MNSEEVLKKCTICKTDVFFNGRVKIWVTVANLGGGHRVPVTPTFLVLN